MILITVIGLLLFFVDLFCTFVTLGFYNPKLSNKFLDHLNEEFKKGDS